MHENETKSRVNGVEFRHCGCPLERAVVLYDSVSQPLLDRDLADSVSIRRGPSPNRFTRKYLSNFFKFIH